MTPRCVWATARVAAKERKSARSGFTDEIVNWRRMASEAERTTYWTTAEDRGLRVDQFLTREISDVSRSRVQQLIERGKVEVDGKALTRAGMKLSGGEEITVVGRPQPEPLKAKAEKIPLDVV